MLDEKLSMVLQQLVSAGKPSFADILSPNPPTNHPSLLPLFEADMKDSELKFVLLGRGPFTPIFPQSLCYHFEEELCYPSPTLFSLTHYDWSTKLCRVLYDAFVWPTTSLWPNLPIIRRDYSYTCAKLWYLVTDRLCINTITSNGIVNFYVAALLLFMSPLATAS
jgi:hypothetical protein